MPLSESQLKLQVLLEVQDDDDGTIAAALNALWLKHDSRALWPRYLYTRLDAVNILLARYREMVRTAGDGRSMHLDQIFDHLLVMQVQFQKELDDFSSEQTAPSVGQMEATSPIMGLPGYPDPNSGVFAGDPISRQLQRFGGGWPL